METLLIILIVVAIIALLVFTYSHFFDSYIRREATATAEMLTAAAKQYQLNQESFKATNEQDRKYIAELRAQLAELNAKLTMVVVRLPKAEEKMALSKMLNGTATEEDTNILKAYLDWIRTLKYEDETPRE